MAQSNQSSTTILTQISQTLGNMYQFAQGVFGTATTATAAGSNPRGGSGGGVQRSAAFGLQGSPGTLGAALGSRTLGAIGKGAMSRSASAAASGGGAVAMGAQMAVQGAISFAKVSGETSAIRSDRDIGYAKSRMDERMAWVGFLTAGLGTGYVKDSYNQSGTTDYTNATEQARNRTLSRASKAWSMGAPMSQEEIMQDHASELRRQEAWQSQVRDRVRIAERVNTNSRQGQMAGGDSSGRMIHDAAVIFREAAERVRNERAARTSQRQDQIEALHRLRSLSNGG